MQEAPAPSRAKTQVLNLKRISGTRVKQVAIHGLRTAMVNTVAVMTTEALNFYLESRGMNSRRITVTAVPNPDRGNPQSNPYVRKSA